MTDTQLLTRFLAGSSRSLEELIRRHTDFVYGVARRRVGAAHAEDVTQAVFILLVKSAAALQNRNSLGGWLHKTACYCCATLQRMERRRRIHEKEAAAMKSTPRTSTPEWTDSLDAGLQRLGRAEREVILLHYLYEHDIRQTADLLHISEAAARKRAQRGLERLRDLMPKPAKATAPSAATVAMLDQLHAQAAVRAPETLARAGFLTAQSAGTATGGLAHALAEAVPRAMRTVLWMQGTAAAAAVLVVSLGAGILIPHATTGRHGADATDYQPEQFNSYSGQQRLDFILAMLDKRDQSLQNFRYSASRRSVNVVPSTGTTQFVRSMDYEVRRNGGKFWQRSITHPGGKDTEEIATKVIESWDGITSRALGFPPYDGEKFHVARIDANRSKNFSDLKLNAIFGFSGVGPTATSASLAKWMEYERRIGVPIDISPVSDENKRPLTVKMKVGPIVENIFYLDPSHDFAICKMSTTIQQANLLADDTLEVTEWERVKDAWVPKRAIERITDSINLDHRQDVEFVLHDISVGGISEADVALDFPPGTKVIDGVKKIDYFVDPDGTYRLNPLADLSAGVVHYPTTKTVGKIDDDTAQLYKTGNIVQRSVTPKSKIPIWNISIFWLTIAATVLVILAGASAYWVRRFKLARS